jgi:hypothetical protein
MRQVQILAESCAMKRLIKAKGECGVDNIKRRRWVFKLAENRPAVDIMQKCIKLIGLISESLIVDEDIFDATTAFQLVGYANGVLEGAG